MEKDPQVIAGMAAERRDEHWRLRSRLRVLPAGRVARLNARARELGEAAEAQIDCRTCASCCRDNWIPVDGGDIARIAACLGVSEAEVRERYTRHDEGEDGIDARPCAFLKGNLCSIYEARPDACRGYPYVGADIRTSMIGVIERAGTCPIVFEMLERLRREVGM